MIISHEHEKYQARWAKAKLDRFNGAYYYSKEIVKNIIPNVKTDRNWVTINVPNECYDHSIVFIHNNMYPHTYDWLKDYKDLVLVCGVPQTVEKVKHLADHTIYIPLSVDVKEVEKYRKPKTKYSAFVGRANKLGGLHFDYPVDIISGKPREEILEAMAEYEKVYAVGRCAIEAKILGCRVEAYDFRYPDPSVWQIVDNLTAASLLQAELDKIDGAK